VSEVVHVPTRKFRGTIPEDHCHSLDTRIRWLWHQRFGTVQTVWHASRASARLLDHTAATLVIQAILGKDLVSITQLFGRLEGGPLLDEENLERDEEEPMRV
jgi:hypothetical protein